MRLIYFASSLLLLFSCSSKESNQETQVLGLLTDSVFTTPLGKTFEIPTPSEKLLAQFEEAKATFEANLSPEK
mgnify:CR=1 FL=1